MAVTAGLRVLIIVLPSAVLVRHVDADALGDHLAQRLRLPARPVVALSAALQRIHTFGDIWTEISRARRVRGHRRHGPVAEERARPELGAVTFGMLVRSLQAAAELAVAMDAPGVRHGIPAPHVGGRRRGRRADSLAASWPPSCPGSSRSSADRGRGPLRPRAGDQEEGDAMNRLKDAAGPCSPTDLRNVVLVGASGAGKTALFDQLVAARVPGRRSREGDLGDDHLADGGLDPDVR